MQKLIAARLLRAVATLFAVSVLTFFMVDLLPGDLGDILIPAEQQNDQVIVEQLREELGLNDPAFVRYGNWLKDAVTGDLGESAITRQPVSTLLSQRLPITLQLTLFAIGFALIFAVPLGIISAYRQGRFSDRAISGGLQLGLSIPNFVVGVFLIWFFAERLGWLPATGWTRLTESVSGNVKGVILPAISLALVDMAVFSRRIRADMISTLQENYVLSAKAKGMSDRFILARHALRPSSLSLITVVGLNIGSLLGGTVVIEQLFAMGGIGRALIDAITKRDYVVIQGLTVFIATVYVFINMTVDFIYIAVDPRIRSGRT